MSLERKHCNIDKYFKNQRIVFELNFCGKFINNAWKDHCAAETNSETCAASLKTYPRFGGYRDLDFGVDNIRYFRDASVPEKVGETNPPVPPTGRPNKVAVPWIDPRPKVFSAPQTPNAPSRGLDGPNTDRLAPPPPIFGSSPPRPEPVPPPRHWMPRPELVPPRQSQVRPATTTIRDSLSSTTTANPAASSSGALSLGSASSSGKSSTSPSAMSPAWNREPKGSASASRPRRKHRTQSAPPSSPTGHGKKNGRHKHGGPSDNPKSKGKKNRNSPPGPGTSKGDRDAGSSKNKISPPRPEISGNGKNATNPAKHVEHEFLEAQDFKKNAELHGLPPTFPISSSRSQPLPVPPTQPAAPQHSMKKSLHSPPSGSSESKASGDLATPFSGISSKSDASSGAGLSVSVGAVHHAANPSTDRSPSKHRNFPVIPQGGLAPSPSTPPYSMDFSPHASPATPSSTEPGSKNAKTSPGSASSSSAPVASSLASPPDLPVETSPSNPSKGSNRKAESPRINPPIHSMNSAVDSPIPEHSRSTSANPMVPIASPVTFKSNVHSSADSLANASPNSGNASPPPRQWRLRPPHHLATALLPQTFTARHILRQVGLPRGRPRPIPLLSFQMTIRNFLQTDLKPLSQLPSLLTL